MWTSVVLLVLLAVASHTVASKYREFIFKLSRVSFQHSKVCEGTEETAASDMITFQISK